MSLSWYETHPPDTGCLGCGCRPRVGEWCQQCEVERTCQCCDGFYEEPLLRTDGSRLCAACYADSGAGDVPMVVDVDQVCASGGVHGDTRTHCGVAPLAADGLWRLQRITPSIPETEITPSRFDSGPPASISPVGSSELGQSTGWPAFSRWWVDLSDVCEDVYRAVGPWCYAMLAVWFILGLWWAVIG